MGRRIISDEIKNQVIGLYRGDKTINEIEKVIKSISKSCIARTIKKYKETGTVRDKPRSGRPRSTSLTDDNAIYRLARKFPKYSQKKLAQEINPALANHISKQTIGRRLLDRKLGSYSAAHKPLLKREDKKKRLIFCKELLQMSDNQLNKIIFSDESNFQVINRDNKVLVRRHANEKYLDRNIVPRLQGGGGSIGIWACITNEGSGMHMLYSGRMDQYKYIETLENALLPTRDIFFPNDDSWIFQQDNAPCHKAHSVDNWLGQMDINVLQWPARSPDLNPIENVWTIIDRKLTESPVTSLTDLKSKLSEYFKNISIDYCKNLYSSIKRRCRMCIKNKGGHIPY